MTRASCGQTLPNSFIYSFAYLFIPPAHKIACSRSTRLLPPRLPPCRLRHRKRSRQATLHRGAFASFVRLWVLLLAKATDEQRHPRWLHHLRGKRCGGGRGVVYEGRRVGGGGSGSPTIQPASASALPQMVIYGKEMELCFSSLPLDETGFYSKL